MQGIKKMTVAQKRVAIAKDTIKWLDGGVIKARTGDYLEFPRNIIIDNQQDKLDDLLKATEKPCNVCALGGMFYSMVRRFDGVPVSVGRINYNTYPHGKDTFNGVGCTSVFIELRKYFSNPQLALIEMAFEAPHYFETTSMRGTTPPERMRAIMRNIIKNKGKFTIKNRVWV